MGIIDNVSLNLSRRLGSKLNKNEKEKAVLNYVLFIILHTLSSLTLAIIFGIITGMALEVLLISITSSWFKRYTGGEHESTPERCILKTIIVCFLLGIMLQMVVLTKIGKIFINLLNNSLEVFKL